MALEQPSRKARFAPARPGSFGPGLHGILQTMNGYIAMALAIFGLGSGIGKVLSESTRPVLRRWGRTLELATPIVVGAVAVMGVILLEVIGISFRRRFRRIRRSGTDSVHPRRCKEWVDQPDGVTVWTRVRISFWSRGRTVRGRDRPARGCVAVWRVAARRSYPRVRQRDRQVPECRRRACRSCQAKRRDLFQLMGMLTKRQLDGEDGGG
jgi:hypothetical protein